jgi:hypothetical protein
MTPPPSFDPQWTTPPPPGPPPGSGAGPLRARRVWGGIGLAMLGHVLTIVVPLAMIGLGIAADGWTIAGVLGQLILFLACLTVGISLMVRKERGIGLGLLIGWGVGVIVLPVVGFGICLALYNATGS